MTKQLKHYQRTQTLYEPMMRSFALIGFTEEKDSCVTLLHCSKYNIRKEFSRFGTFTAAEIELFEGMSCQDQYKADEYSLIIRLS